jgi:hypothetical protein
MACTSPSSVYFVDLTVAPEDDHACTLDRTSEAEEWGLITWQESGQR